MMTTKIDRNAAEAYLIRMLNTISKSGIRSMSSLRAVPSLCDGFITALHTWMTSVGFATSACASIIRANGVSAEDMTSDLLTRLINPERRICRTKNRTEQESREAALHPAMDYVLKLGVKRGAAAVIKYLMRMCRNFCVEKFRKEREEQEHTVQTDPETLRHADANAQDTGAVKKHPTAADTSESVVLRRELLASAFSCFGRDFLHDVSMLGDALNVKRQAMADVIFSGRSYELACALVRYVNTMLDYDYTEALAPFLRAARAFRLPEALQDMKALMRRMYRATSTASHQAMKTRVLAASA